MTPYTSSNQSPCSTGMGVKKFRGVTMALPALSQTVSKRVQLKVVQGNKGVEGASHDIHPEVVLFGGLLVILQILDGVLTAIGVNHFGTHAEGNALIRNLMEFMGPVEALIAVKLFAIGVVVALCKLSSRVSWLSTALKCMVGLYLFVAVLPWTYILYSHIF